MQFFNHSNETQEKLTANYGELLYDLALSLLRDPYHATLAYREMIKTLIRSYRSTGSKYTDFERAWALRGTMDVLLKFAKKHRLPQISDQTEKDILTSADSVSRIRHLDSYLQRIRLENQIAWFLIEKHEQDPIMVAAALNIPADSLQVINAQTFSALSDWIWEKTPDEKIRSEIRNHTRSLNRYHLPRELIERPFDAMPGAATESTGEPAVVRVSRWQRTPWYVRNSVEGLALACVALFVIAMIPRLKNFYDKSLERRIRAYEVSEKELDLGSIMKQDFEDLSSVLGSKLQDNPKRETDKVRSKQNIQLPPLGEQIPFDDLDDSEEFSGNDHPESDIDIGDSQIWRFNIRTTNPKEIRPKITQILKKYDIKDASLATEGVLAPGGIQFNVLFPKESIPALMSELKRIAVPFGSEEALTRTTPSDTRQALMSKSDAGSKESGVFTWFKNKSRKKIPDGQARIVIWLSQV